MKIAAKSMKKAMLIFLHLNSFFFPEFPIFFFQTREFLNWLRSIETNERTQKERLMANRRRVQGAHLKDLQKLVYTYIWMRLFVQYDISVE